jgi:hypothetical protein
MFTKHSLAGRGARFMAQLVGALAVASLVVGCGTPAGFSERGRALDASSVAPGPSSAQDAAMERRSVAAVAHTMVGLRVRTSAARL